MHVVNGNFMTWLKINFKAVYLLLGFNVLLGILTILFTYLVFQGNDSLALVFFGAQVLPGTVAPFSTMSVELWRFLTSAFLHDGLIHLLFNMYALAWIGGYVERYYGARKLITAYIITALAGSGLSFLGTLLTLWGNNGATGGLVVSVGASGAIFGLIGLILGNRFLKRHNYAPELSFDINGMLWIVAVNLLLGFGINALGAGVAINNWAHVGGLLGGFILGAFLDTKNTLDQPKFKRYLETGLFFLCGILFVVAWGFNLVSMINLAASVLH